MPPITRVAWRPFRLRYRKEARAATGAAAAREGVLVVVEAGGALGLGEASPLVSEGGDIRETLSRLETEAQRLLGKSPAEAWVLETQPVGASAGAAACGVETALAALLSEEAGVPLHAWPRGGEPSQESVMVPVNALIDAESPMEVASETVRLVESGFRTVKLKVGFAPALDMQRIAALRSVGGPGTAIRLDANGAWSEHEAVAMLRELAGANVEFVEQPVAVDCPGGLETLARVRKLSPVPIAVDEGCRSLAQLERVLEFEAADAVIVKPMVTGLREAKKMVDRCAAAGLPAVVTTAMDGGIGTTLAMHLAATLPEPRPASGLATHDRFELDFVTGVPAVRHGYVTLLGTPGSGLTLDHTVLERLATGDWCEVRL